MHRLKFVWANNLHISFRKCKTSIFLVLRNTYTHNNCYCLSLQCCGTGRGAEMVWTDADCCLKLQPWKALKVCFERGLLPPEATSLCVSVYALQRFLHFYTRSLYSLPAKPEIIIIIIIIILLSLSLLSLSSLRLLSLGTLLSSSLSSRLSSLSISLSLFSLSLSSPLSLSISLSLSLSLSSLFSLSLSLSLSLLSLSTCLPNVWGFCAP